jgi:hypothetical protein
VATDAYEATLSLRIPPELHAELRAEADERDESLSAVVRRRLGVGGSRLDDHERRIAALEEMANRAY